MPLHHVKKFGECLSSNIWVEEAGE